MSVETRILLALMRRDRLLLGEVSALTRVPVEVVIDVLSKYTRLVEVRGEEVFVVKPVDLALELATRGVELARISENLSWKDFEELSARILEGSGFEVARRVMLTTPVRLEIDVLGVEPASRLGIAIDCKHWSLATSTKLAEAAKLHAERIAKVTRYYSYFKARYRLFSTAKKIVPAIVTLFTPPLRIHENVLIFSIGEMPNVIRDINTVLDTMGVKPVRLPGNGARIDFHV